MVLSAPSRRKYQSGFRSGTTAANGRSSPASRHGPASAIAELPDASSLRVVARMWTKPSAAGLSISQTVTAQLDAIADRQFTGKIERIGTIATSDFSAGWPIPRNFTLDITLDQKDPRLKPGMTAQITVIVDRVPNAIFDSGAGLVPEVGTDRGLCVERFEV